MRLSISMVCATLLAITQASTIIFNFTEEDVIKAREAEFQTLESRQDEIGTTANEFLEGGCRDVIYIFARGSGQSGNMGEMPGTHMANALKSALGSSTVAAQGVDYRAGWLTNLLSGGCSPEEAADMRALITQAAAECPSSKIVVSGYSQGAAMVHRSVEAATDAVKARIFAAVTFGDSQNARDNSQIPNFDRSKTLIICNDGDLICQGILIIMPAHTDYTGSVDTAVSFIRSKVGL